MTVNDVYSICLYAVGKNLNQGYLSPSDFNVIINQGQRSYVSYLLGTFQQYVPGRPIARVELGQNSVVRDRLSPVIYGYILNIDSSGFSAYPGDYVQTDAMWSMYGFQRIRYADQHNFVSMYNSVIDPIVTNPIYELEYSGFRFFPNSLVQSRLHYVKDPPDMVWGYVEDSNGVPVYSAAHSTQPVWDDLSLYEIIVRGLQIVGVNLNSAMVYQYSQEIKNLGQ